MWSPSLTMLALLIAGCGAATPFCTAKTGTPTKPLPDLDVPAFTTEYRAIIKDNKYTQWGKEYYDSVSNKVRLDVLDRGIESTLLIDYSANSFIQLEYLDKKKEKAACYIQQLDQVHDDDNLDIFGFKLHSSSSGSKIHVVSSSQVLQLAKGKGVQYVKETDIDGLKVDQFQSCLTWDDAGATFLLDYYFTTTDFQPRDSMTPKQIPVRATVEGVIEMAGQTIPFEHVYEYLDFRVFPFLPNETFGIPEFIVCNGSADTWQRPFPTLPEAMSYTVEKVTESADGTVDIELANVHLSTNWRIIRVDQGHRSSICDFSTGIEYVIDAQSCTVRAINPNNVAWAQVSKGIVSMKDRPELFYLKQGFFYGGHAKFRELSTHSYAALVGDERIQAYVSTDDTTPLGLHVVNTKDGTSTYYNIFNFDPTSNRSMENPFDIQRCRDSSQMRDYTMKFISQFYYYPRFDDESNLSNEITTALRNKAAEIAEVSPLQIITKDFSRQINDGYWMFRILDQDSESDRAKVEKPLDLKSTQDIFKLLDSGLFNGKFSFKIYTGVSMYNYIPFEGLSLTFSGSLYILTVSSDLKYNYRRQTGQCVKEFADNADFTTKHNAHECAQACADTRHVSCTYFEYVDTTKACQLSWSPETPVTLESTSCQLYRRTYMNDFSLFPGVVMTKDDDVNYRKAEDAEVCAKLCFEETGFHCESFDYCKSEKRCQINKSHFYSAEANPQPGDDVLKDCQHYSRTYDDYDTYFQRDFEAPEYLSLKTDSYVKCSYMCSKDEDGCMAFTVCSPNEGETEGSCKLLPSSQANKVSFKSVDEMCTLFVAPGIQNTKAGEKPAFLGSKSGDGGARYNGGAMFALALGMLVAGAGLTGLTVFLLQHFKIWTGF